MATHEIKKCTKIVDELLTYLLSQGHVEIDLNVVRENGETKFTFTTDKCNTNLIDNLCSKLTCNKERELEEYSWELLGESDSSEELSLCGMLIDQLEILEDGEKTTFVLHRKY